MGFVHIGSQKKKMLKRNARAIVYWDLLQNKLHPLKLDNGIWDLVCSISSA